MVSTRPLRAWFAPPPGLNDFVVEAAEPQLTVEPHVVGLRTVLVVAGEVDLGSASNLRRAVNAALGAGVQDLWIDLSATTFLDSCGLHLLITATEQARDLGRRLAIICPTGAVRRVFDVAGVAAALPLYEDRGAANRDA
jgi:anti-anti-sigma factor